MSKGKVLIAAPVHELLINGLEENGYELLLHEKIVQSEGLQLIKDCVGVITSTRLQLNKELIDAAPKLQFIGRMGSGMEVIDVLYAESKGIKCVGSPEGNCNAVAEHALGMLIALNKNILKSNNEISAGKWIRDENRGVELEGKTIGIIGYGNTGKAFAKLLKGFNMQILVFDKYKEIESEPGIVVCKNLDQMRKEADIISLHVPYQPDTYHLVDNEFLEQVSKSITLINTSRGSVVDSKILNKFLDNGKIQRLALDVWEEEPMEKMSEEYRSILNALVQRNNTLITAHIAGYSKEALYKMSLILLERIIE